ncbi:hypothetical protein MIMGU_mgv1a019762mg [Erythranthe guttata]|uniref:GH16 domain-containing protein n=1 Tax=Erythranthe guttata TaxID=4155 RepID=A0A022PZ44_ERYGU|nr:hypothetical protein MIMGU_mgv1a019762mg [Erythranthe guttata]
MGRLVDKNQLSPSPNDYYTYLWGGDNFMINPQRTEVMLKLNNYSGAGFKSKQNYGSGSEYSLTSLRNGESANSNHFELDFEFFGTNGTVQTNVFMNDTGHREQAFKLPFNPAWDFHTYEIRWNPFSIDTIPIRVHYHTPQKPYPIGPMHVEASIWNPPPEWIWPGPVNWANAPFIAHYTDFAFNACAAPSDDIKECYSTNYYWNTEKYTKLSDVEKRQMKVARATYMIYDYCSNPSTWQPECSL